MLVIRAHAIVLEVNAEMVLVYLLQWIDRQMDTAKYIISLLRGWQIVGKPTNSAFVAEFVSKKVLIIHVTFS